MFPNYSCLVSYSVLWYQTMPGTGSLVSKQLSKMYRTCHFHHRGSPKRTLRLGKFSHNLASLPEHTFVLLALPHRAQFSHRCDPPASRKFPVEKGIDDKTVSAVSDAVVANAHVVL